LPGRRGARRAEGQVAAVAHGDVGAGEAALRDDGAAVDEEIGRWAHGAAMMAGRGRGRKVAQMPGKDPHPVMCPIHCRVIHMRPATPDQAMPVPLLPPLRLTGATVLREGVLARRSLALADGRLTRGPLPEVALPGCLILPGIVDLHGAGAAREAAAAGVTTGWVAQDWSWGGGAGAPEWVEAALAGWRPEGIDLRVVLRAETHLVAEGARLIALVRRHGVDQVVFRDSLTELLDMAVADPARFSARAAAAGRTPGEMTAELHALRARGREVPRHLCRLAEAFDGLGVVYGSLGDPDAETREMFSMLGARVAMFPALRRVAASARAMGDPVVLSATDVAAGRVTAVDLVGEGFCSALASGCGGPENMAAAAWRLVDGGLCDLARAWALVSAAPAGIARLPDRGRLDPGRRADFVVMREDTRAVEATVSGGRLAYATGEAGARLREAAGVRALAAE
jgi:alpha-D-ribose 1-methylphosphonate 5-triphosphate diphosphatase